MGPRGRGAPVMILAAVLAAWGGRAAAAPPGDGAWVLRGTVLGGARPAAVLEAPDGRQRRLHVGETAAAGVRLVAVAPDHAVIEAQEGRRTVRFGERLDAGSMETRTVPMRLALRAAAAVPDLLASGALLPHQRDGRPAGFYVNRLPPGSPLAALGLRPGDVIVMVGGTPVSAATDGWALYRALRGRGRIEVEVARAGRPHRIGYRLVR